MSDERGPGDRSRATLLIASGVLAGAVAAAARVWKRHRNRSARSADDPVDRGPHDDAAKADRQDAALEARRQRERTRKRNHEIRAMARPWVIELSARYDSDSADLLDTVRAELKSVESELEAARDGNVPDTRLIELEAVAYAHRQAQLRARSHTNTRGPLDAEQRRTLEDGVRGGNAAAKPGDVWWVEIPNDNIDEDDPSKRRPAVVVSATAEPGTPCALYTVIWATSQQKRADRHGYLATSTLPSWPLHKTASWLNLRSAAEVRGPQLRGYAGELSPPDLGAVESAPR